MMVGCGFGLRALLLAAAVAAACTDTPSALAQQKLPTPAPVLSPAQLYQTGVDKFKTGDYLAAGRALSQLAPFDVAASDFALPTRYLLGRVHHLSGERPEALAHYTAVIADFSAVRKKAADALANANTKLTAQQRDYYTVLTRTVPDYVNRSLLYSGEILTQAGKNAAAQDIFVKIEREVSDASIVQEAKLFHGVCQLQALNYAEAEKLLNDVATSPTLGDQAQWWAARARALAADPIGAQYGKITQAAAEQILQASGKTAELAKAGNKEAHLRRAEMLLEAADTFILARQFTRASAVYAQVATEYPGPSAQQALERQVSALHLAGAEGKPDLLDASDKVAADFIKAYPKSTLMAGVVFRTAENAYMRAILAGADAAGAQKNFATAAALYQNLIQKYPDFSLVSAARGGLGTCQYQLGQYAAAVETLERIPDAERIGDLASVNFLMADALLRSLPAKTDDALTASHLLEDATRAAKLLVSFAAGNDRHPAFTDALMKAALCYERLASVLADPMERGKALVQAKEMLDRAVNTLATRRSNVAKDTTDLGDALMQRAKIFALSGDLTSAVGDLRLFLRHEKLKDSPDLPLAVIRLSVYLRASGRAAETLELLPQIRTKLGEQSPWSVALLAEHAAALKETGKPIEAKALFETIALKAPKTIEGATAAGRLLQCQREEFIAKLAAAKKTNGSVDEILSAMRKTVDDAKAQSPVVIAISPEAGARFLYEAAWMSRLVGDAEIEKLAPKKLKDIAEQPGETKALELFQRSIDAAPEAPLAIRARYDLADMWLRRGEHEIAIDHLVDALAQGPDLALAERIRVKIAASLVARGDAASVANAFGYIKSVVANTNSPSRGEALYFLAECYAMQEDWQRAAENLVILRVNGFTEMKGISDKAVWRLAQAQKEIGKPDDARATLEMFIAKYSDNPRVDEARFELAQSYGKIKKIDAALITYAEIIRRNISPLVGKAQLQTALIKLEQKNYQEAVSVLLAMKPKNDPTLLADTRKALSRLVQDAPNTPWAASAQKRLTELQ